MPAKPTKEQEAYNKMKENKKSGEKSMSVDEKRQMMMKMRAAKGGK